jgi:hypothetical protein
MTIFVFVAALGLLAGAPTADTLPASLKDEHNPGKRSEMAIELADKSLDQAREYYRTGDVARAEAELDQVGTLADECYQSAQEAHKSKYWKKAEQKIAALSRKVHSISESLGYEQRDKAQKLGARLDSIHDKLLAGVMSK